MDILNTELIFNYNKTSHLQEEEVIAVLLLMWDVVFQHSTMVSTADSEWVWNESSTSLNQQQQHNPQLQLLNISYTKYLYLW